MTSSHATVIAEFIDTVWNQGNLADIDRFVHDGYMVDGDCFGIDGVRNNVRSFRQAFPDLRVDIDQIVEDATGVAALLQLRGTHLGEWKGWPATGKSLDFREAAFWTLADGKLFSGTFVADALRLRIQLGVIPDTVWRSANSPEQ
ncbi:MAG: ester cyclase [Thermomicrobiales bacterium]